MFLARVSGAIAGVIAMAIGIPLVGYTILPTLKRRKPEWADAGSPKSVHTGFPKELDFVLSVTDGWQKTTEGKVLSGPGPRPPDPLLMKIEDGRLLVMYKEFKAGTAVKIEL